MAYRSADSTVSAFGAAAVTAHDTNTIAVTRGLWVGGAGDVKVTMEAGNDVTFVGVAAGTLLPIQVIRVFSTGTTGSDILALY